MNDVDVTGLIEHGRDRDAAVLGAAPTKGAHMDVLAQLDELGPALAGVVGGITPAQLDDPTPCAQFTVRGVLQHMLGGAAQFAAAFLREQPPTAPVPEDVLGGFGPALATLVEAIRSPGALDRTVAAPFGEVSGETFARFIVLDGLVHGWDLATATGQAYAPPDALVADVTAFATDALPPLRDGDTFAEPTDPPASATPIQRLAALTGRDV